MKRLLVFTALLTGLSLVVGVSGRAEAPSFNAGISGSSPDVAQRLPVIDSSLIPTSSYMIQPRRIHPASRGLVYDRYDVELLARVIYAEARGEPFLGQVAVGAVIVNRSRHPRFPSTIHGVVFQDGALCTVRDGQINLRPDQKARQAAVLALAGVDPTGGSLFFYNPKWATSRWIRRRPVQKQIGQHRFAR